MSKYIIEFGDKPSYQDDNTDFYPCKQIPWWSVSATYIQKLTPLEKELEEAHQKGYDEAWETITKIAKMPDGERGKIFGETWISNILNKFSISEIINILDGQEPEQDEIKVGDGVKDRTDDCGVVTWIYGNDAYVLWQDGSTGNYAADELIKTGRHFNFLTSLLNAMKEGAE